MDEIINKEKQLENKNRQNIKTKGVTNRNINSSDSRDTKVHNDPKANNDLKDPKDPNDPNDPNDNKATNDSNQIGDNNEIPFSPDINKLLKKAVTPDDILLNLKIIGCIQKLDRISKNDDNILEIENKDWFQPVRRWWFGRSRNETINNIKKIIETSFDLTDKTLDKERHKTNASKSCQNNNTIYFDEENSKLLQRFVIEMKNATKGLNNLKITYGDDTRIVSELDLLLERIALRIEKINAILRIDMDVVS